MKLNDGIENSAPVHNKRNLRMMELKLRMGWNGTEAQLR